MYIYVYVFIYTYILTFGRSTWRSWRSKVDLLSDHHKLDCFEVWSSNPGLWDAIFSPDHFQSGKADMEMQHASFWNGKRWTTAKSKNSYSITKAWSILRWLGPFVDAVTQVTRRTSKAASSVPRRILLIFWMPRLPLNQKQQVGCWGVATAMPQRYLQGLTRRLQRQVHLRRQCEKVLVQG